MTEEIRTWEITDNGPERAYSSLKEEGYKEKDFQKWIEQKPEIVHPKLTKLGTFVTVGTKEIDILGILPDGSITVVELKREKSPRETVAQAIDYASRIANIEKDRIGEALGNEVRENLEQYLENRDMDRTDIKEKPQIIIVAPELDNSTENMIDYLSEMYEVPANGVVINYTKTSDSTEILTRTAVVSEQEMEERTTRKKVTMSDIKQMFENKGIQNELETLRGVNNFVDEEDPRVRSDGASVRYWKSIDGNKKVIFGIRAENSKKDSIDLWVRQEKIAQLKNQTKEETEQEIRAKESFKLEKKTKTRTDIKISNESEAKEFVKWVTEERK